MAYATDGMLGVNLSRLDAGTTTNGENAKFPLGTRVSGTDGSVWQYCQAGAAITQYSWVAIDETFQAVMGTTTLAAAGYAVGFAQSTIADNDFFWAAVHAPGEIIARVLGSCAADVQLYTTATAGALDDTSASVILIRGVVCITTNPTTAAGTSEVIAVYPSGAATP